MDSLPVMTREEYLTKLHTWAMVYRESTNLPSESPIARLSSEEQQVEHNMILLQKEFDPHWEFISTWLVNLALPESGSAEDFCDAIVNYAGGEASNFVKSWRYIFMRVRKSNLLARLLYNGEELRTEKCPNHDGKWRGVSVTSECECVTDCNITGWLPNKS